MIQSNKMKVSALALGIAVNQLTMGSNNADAPVAPSLTTYEIELEELPPFNDIPKDNNSYDKKDSFPRFPQWSLEATILTMTDLSKTMFSAANKKTVKATTKKATSTALVVYQPPPPRKQYKVVISIPTLLKLLQQESSSLTTNSQALFGLVQFLFAYKSVTEFLKSMDAGEPAIVGETAIVVHDGKKTTTTTSTRETSIVLYLGAKTTPSFGASSTAFLGTSSPTQKTTSFSTPLFGSEAPLFGEGTTSTPIFGDETPLFGTGTASTSAFGADKSSTPTFGTSMKASTTSRNSRRSKAKSTRVYRKVPVDTETRIKAKIATAATGIFFENCGTEKELRSYFRKSVFLKWHPDKNSDPDAAEVFKALSDNMEKELERIRNSQL